MARRSAKKKSGLTVNFKGVESGGRRRIPEDDYLMEVAEVTEEVSSNDNDQLRWVFKVAEGPHKGATFYVYTTLTESSLWKLHALLTALGVEVPDDEMELELDDYVGETCMGVIEDDVYDGKKQSKMVDFYAVDGAADEKPARGKKDKDEDDDDDEKPSRRRGRDKDEEDEKPARGRRGKKEKEPEGVSSDEVQEMDEDDLEKLIEEHDLQVDLDDYKTLRKQRAAVIDALEEAGLIADGDGGDEKDEEEEDDRPTSRRGSSRRGAKDEDDGKDDAAAKRKARREARKNRR